MPRLLKEELEVVRDIPELHLSLGLMVVGQDPDGDVDIPSGQVHSLYGIWQCKAFVHWYAMRHPIARIQDNPSGSSSGIESEYGLHRYE